MGGARILEETKVVGIIRKRTAGSPGWSPTRARITAEYVVNCGGMWARELGAHGRGGRAPARGRALLSLHRAHRGGGPQIFPVFEDLDYYTYYREEGGGLMLGLFEPDAAPWGMDGIPEDFSFGDLPPDWDRMIPHLDAAMNRVPVVRDAGVRILFNGPESFTPDHWFYIGEALELKNYFVAAGMNSEGVLLGGGVGKAVAEWIKHGLPGIDVYRPGFEPPGRFPEYPPIPV